MAVGKRFIQVHAVGNTTTTAMAAKSMYRGGNMKTNILLIVFVALLVVGCGTTDVVKKTDDTYMVSAQYGSMNGSWDRAMLEAIDKAKVYCDGRKEKMVLVEERREGVYGFSPQRVDITFRCDSSVKLSEATVIPVEEKLKNLKSLYEKKLITEVQYNEAVRATIGTNQK